jgi:O-antigen/teichoic acid export membrane protein
MAIALKKVTAKAGLDKTISYTILLRIAQSAGGIVVLILLTRFLKQDEQGYFYTFISILSIRMFFELGFTTVLTQFVAHEYAYLGWKNDKEVSGDEFYLSRLASIIQLSLKWFFVISVVLFVVLLASGWIFFSNFNVELKVEWKTPWVVLAISTSLVLFLDLFFAVLEGLGRIEQITKLRLIHQLINLFFISLFLIADFKLLAQGLALLISTVVTIALLKLNGNIETIRNLWVVNCKWHVNYRKEILPFQSRIAIGNISNYFIFQLFNPVLFATQGSVVAGQMGATQAFLGGIVSIANSWMSTKIPLFSRMVAKRKFRLLNLSFRKNLIIAILVCLTGLLIFNVVLVLVKHYYPALGNRFLGFLPVIFLSLTQLANVIGSAQGYYLRSFKKDPFFVSAIVIGVLTGLSTIICSMYFGITAITFGCFFINGVIGLLWGTAIFVKKKAEWSVRPQ